ncbi:MAG: hypothetical protein Kow00121_43220 [Elainellaceae cyanobacterium]
MAEQQMQNQQQEEMNQSQNNQQQSNEQGSNRLNIDNLPQDVRDKLPEEAQHIFIAAYNSILDNHQTEETANRVAWQTIENNDHYIQDKDGKWRRDTRQVDSKHSPIHTTAS